MHIQLQSEFDEILQPLGSHAAEFFLAASLYHARKVSFAMAAQMAGLDFDGFKSRLTEHFHQGYIMADECVLEDIHTVNKLYEVNTQKIDHAQQLMQLAGQVNAFKSIDDPVLWQQKQRDE